MGSALASALLSHDVDDAPPAAQRVLVFVRGQCARGGMPPVKVEAMKTRDLRPPRQWE
jgi:hypothetical protein